MESRRVYGEGAIVPIPHASTPAASASGFILCPSMLRPSGPFFSAECQELYRLAYEQAAQTVRPAWHERGLVASWN